MSDERSAFQVFYETVPGASLVLAPDSPHFTILAATDSYLRATKTTRDIIGRGIFEVFPDDPDDPASSGTNARLSFERVLATRAPDAMAVQKHSIRRPASEGGGFEERYWSPLNTPVIGGDGEILYIHHRVEDVTEFVRERRKGAEQAAIVEALRTRAGEMEADILRRARELQDVNLQLRTANDALAKLSRDTERRSQQALRESELRYKVLFDSIDEGFCVVDVLFSDTGQPTDYRFVEVNSAFKRQTGLSNAVGRTMRELAPSHERYWFEVYGKVASTGEPMRFENRAAALGRWFDVYAFRIGDPDLCRVAILFNDVTDRKRAAEALREADRRKDEFLGVLSHELRNPLAPIRNSLFILDHAEPSGEQARRAREVMNRQVTQLTRLVDDLLDVTRIARGKVELRRVDLDLVGLARRTAEDHRALLRQHDVEFAVDVPPTPVVVHGDEARLAQILGNLLHNAAKFTPAGGHVALSLVATGGAAELRVRDTGAGMEPELLERLFQPFTQSEQTLARTNGGLGLGLAVVKGFVELHGGTVTGTSDGLGRGSEFLVRLPVVATPATRVRLADAPRTATQRRYRVLVVDDNVDAAASLAELVRMFGHEVEIAHDGPSALERARTSHPDVVLCDIGLPGLSGYDVAKALRGDGMPSGLRLVAVSGYARPEDVKKAEEAGFDAHVSKPADPEKIARLLA